MPIKILIIGGLLFFIFRSIIKQFATPPSVDQETNKKKSPTDNIVDAEYTVVDDDK